MRSLVLMTALAGLTGSALAGTTSIVLDDFASDPNGLPGGPRSVSSNVLANPFNQGSSFDIDTGFSFNAINGAAIFNSGSGVEQEAEILWNNDGAGLNLDALALGIVGFELDFLFVDQDFTMEITLGTDGGGSVVASYLVAAGGDRTESVSLADFSFDAGFDATDVDSVRIGFNSEGTTVASLDFITTEFRAVVPAPGAATVLALGGLLAARRRR